LLAITKAREGIPFPSVVEIFIMEFFFELLREAGIRLPRPAGSAVSIVGALIIGEAAIEAGISSPVVVVIVALTGISSFIFHYHTATGIRVLRFLFMILAAVLGGFGIMIGFFLLLFHLVNLRSLGVPYLWPLAPFHSTRIRDVFIRVPLKKLLRKTHSVHEGDEE
jgi:spore germination protein KA/spore germination protein